MAGNILSEKLRNDATALFTDGLKTPTFNDYLQFTSEVIDNNASLDIADLATDNSLEEVHSAGAISPMGDIDPKVLTLMDAYYKKKIAINFRDIQTGKAGTKLLEKAKAWSIAILRKKNQLVASVLAAAGSTTGVDGQYLIDTDHPAGSSNQSNKASGPLSYTNVQTGRTTMRKFKDRKGNLLGINPGVLLVPPDLEDAADEICKSANDPSNANNAVNTVKGLKPIVFPFLTASTYWFLVDPKIPIRAIALHTSMQKFTITPKMDDEDNYYTFAKYYGVAGAGDWRGIYGYVG